MYTVESRTFATLKEIAAFYKIPYTTFLHRIDAGLSIEDSINPAPLRSEQITAEGKTYESLASAARFHGVPLSTVRQRLLRGWTAEQSLGLAAKPRQSRKNATAVTNIKVTVKGKEYSSVREAARAFGFSGQKLYNRLKKGLTPEQALEIEPFPDWFTPGKGKFATTRKRNLLNQEIKKNKRQCSNCKEIRPLEDFHRSSSGKRYTRCSTCTAKYFLRYRYGITFQDFLYKLHAQDKKCAICKVDLEIKPDDISRTKNVAVDHCHASGKVRGILCKNCNFGLGFFFDSESNLLNAIKYLRFYG